jgi:methanogenic corrinoid protein MtbC1
MSTEETSLPQPEQTKESALVQTILKGDEENAVKLASEMSRDKHESNDVIDTISEAMNIATDLHEVEKYSDEQVEKSEKAAESALEAVKGKIRVEQKRLHGRVMVASLAADPHSFECTLMLTMLKASGFTPVNGGSELTPKQLTEAVKSQKPDVLAMPILTQEAADQLREIVPSLSHGKQSLGIVVFGRGADNLSTGEGLRSVEQDSLGAMSRVTELLIARE